MVQTLKALVALGACFALGAALWYATLSPASRRLLGYRPLAMLGLITVIAFLSPNLWLLYAAAFLLVPLLATRVSLVAPVFLAGFVALPPLAIDFRPGGLYVALVSCQWFLCWGAVIALLTARGRLGRPAPGVDLAALLIVVLLAVVYARGEPVNQMVRAGLSAVVSFGLPYLIFSRAVRSVEDLRLLLLAVGMLATLFAVEALFEAVKGWPLYRDLYARYPVQTLDTMTVYKMRAGLMRSSGSFVEATSLGFFLVFGLLAIWALRRAFRAEAARWLLLAVVAAGLITPVSRAAWLGSLLGIALVELYRGRAKIIALLVGTAVAGVAALSPVLAASPRLAQLLGLAGDARSTSEYREQLIQRGVEEFAEAPLWGRSLTDVQAALRDLRQGEGIIDFVNTYIFLGLVSGAVGLALFLVAMGAPTLRLWGARRGWRRDGEALGPVAYVGAAMLTLPILLSFTGFGGMSEFMLACMLGLSAALLRLAAAPRDAPQPARPAHGVAWAPA